jgi:hypothetical protein
MLLHSFKVLLAGLTTLSILAVATAVPAQSATTIHSSASAVLNSAPPAIEYVGGFGGTIAGLAVNGTVAYVGEGSSLTVLDISDATHPIRLARLPLAEHANDLALDGQRLYVANGNAGLLIYDVSDPIAPQQLGTFLTPQPATRVRVQSTLAYVVAGDMLIVDVQNSSAPAQLGSYHPSSTINNLVVVGSRVYLAYGSTFSPAIGGVSIVDVVSPSAPAGLGGISLSYETALDVQVDGNLIYAITIADSRRRFEQPRLLIADISNVTSPTILGSITLSTAFFSISRASLLMANGLAYVAGYPGGLLAFDVHTPAAPTLVGQSATLGGSADLQLVGEQLYAVTNDHNDPFPGFQIISLHTPASPIQLGAYDSFALIQGIDVENGIANMLHYSRGFQIVDVHDPARPIGRGAYAIGGGPRRMQLVGDRAYVNGGNSGLNILDLSNADQPIRIGGLAPSGSTMDIRVVGNLAYIVMINQLVIVDISDPSNPVQLGLFSQTTGSDAGVDVVGNRAYFATGNQGVVVVDVSDPAHPVARGAYTALARASYVQVAGSRAYVAAGTDGLVILDLTNPDNPTLLGQAYGPQNAFYVRVVNGLAYVADYYGAIQIFDVREPATPTLIAEYRTGGSVRSLDVDSDLVYIAAGGAGLQIVRLHRDQLTASAQIGSAGGSVATVDGGVGIDIPPGAITSTATLTITPALDPALPPAAAHILRVVTLEARDGSGQPLTNFDLPYTLTISYTDQQLDESNLRVQQLDESNLRLLYWNGSAWAAPHACDICGIDTALNRVTLATDRIGTFALVGATEPISTGSAPTITSAAPPAVALVHHRYHHIFIASGSPTPTFHVSLGALPPGLSLNSSSGVLDGMPSALGSYTFTIAASNGLLPDSEQSVTLTVRAAIYLPMIQGS